jgi:hypothetical protein
LDDLDRFVSLCWDAEGKFLGKLRQAGMEIRSGSVKLGGDRANWEWGKCDRQPRNIGPKGMKYVPVVNRNGEREQTKDGVWKSLLSKLQCIYRMAKIQ